MRNIKYLVVLFLFFGCSKPKSNSSRQEIKEVWKPKYATLFYVNVYEDKKELVIKNPWDSLSEYGRYTVSKESKNVITLSGASIGFMDALDQLDNIRGVGLKKYVYNDFLQKEQVLEVGESHQLNTELLLSSGANYVFVSGFESANKQLKNLEKSGIVTISTLEWMERHPLARAEWIKFYGEFFGEENTADSIFEGVEKEYQALKGLSKNKLPSVMMGSVFKDVWYSPAGESYVAELLRDAGTNYFWDKEKGSGSLSLNIEDVIKNQLHTEFWFNSGQAKSLDELKASNPLLKEFDCVKQGEIYNYTKKVNELGGNDFWESGVVYPHRILKDYIKILHPELIQEPLYYYEKLK